MTASYDIIVIGGGAIGAACARELASAGRRVVVVEQGHDAGQAWRAAAGMLASQIESDADDPLFELGLAGRDHYHSLGVDLRETTGIDLGLWQHGIANIAGDEVEALELQAKVAWQRQHGHSCDWLDAREARRRWPWLGQCEGALWAPRDGALDPERLVSALLADAERLGTVLVQDRATAIRQQAGKVVGIDGEQARYSAAHIVVAAGAWSGRLAGLPQPLPVEPVRGQMAAFAWPAGVPRAIVYHRDGYLLARDGEAIAGSTMEHAGFDPVVTVPGLAKIVATSVRLCPGLTGARVERSWAGLRPMTPDGLPIIGPDPNIEGLWYATGHGRNGILLAGITGVIVRQLLAGQPTQAAIGAFAPDRFSD